MVGFDVIGDVSGMWQEGVANVASGVSGMGAEGLGTTTQTLADALDVFAGTASIISVLASLRSAYNAVEAVQVAALATTRAVNPITWPWLAAALAVGAATAAFAYGVTRNYQLKANLSDPSESLATAMTVGVLA